MKKSSNMKKTSETKPKYSCEFCKREFLRESTIVSHICEYKHRFLEKDKQGNRIGFQTWLQFYKRNSVSKKPRNYEEFIRSAYYTAFVKFGSYCIDAKVINVNRFADWLLKNQVRLDTWNTDTNYTKFLIEYLREEDAYDAIARSIETTIELAELANIVSKDLLRYGNKNKICYAITTGKISPWMLYQSESGRCFLDTLDETQVKMLLDYINPELWAIKFKRDPDLANKIKELLTSGGY